MTESRFATGPYWAYLIACLLCCALAGFGIYWAQDNLVPFFMTQPWINGTILALLGLGLVLCIGLLAEVLIQGRQLNHLSKEIGKASSVADATDSIGAIVPGLVRDRCVAILQTARHVGESIQDTAAALSDATSEADDLRAAVVRHLIGVMIILGLIGTVWGLLLTVSGIGGVLESLVPDRVEDVTKFVTDLKSSIGGMLKGMSTAFSSSLFGLGGSVLLGFMDVFVRQGRSRLLAALDEFIFARLLPSVSKDLENTGTTPREQIHKALQTLTSETAQTRVAMDTGQMTRREVRDELRRTTRELEGLARKIGNLETDTQQRAKDVLTEMRDQTKLFTVLGATLNGILEHMKLTSKATDHMDAEISNELGKQTSQFATLVSHLERQTQVMEGLVQQISEASAEHGFEQSKLQKKSGAGKETD